MAVLWLAPLFLLLALLSPSQANLPRHSAPEAEAWWRQHPTPETWQPAGAELLASCRTWFQPDRPDTWGPDYRGWFDLARWTQLGSPEILARARIDPDTFIALARSPGLISTVLASLHPNDDPAGALAILASLIRRDPDGVRDFPQLATALAVVWDQPFPRDWPHPQVHRASLLLSTGSVADRFADFVAQERRGRLEFRLRDLTVDELIFVVDTPVAESEFQWARENFRTSLNQFDRVFFQVPYNHHRLRERAFVWPADLPYSLDHILNRGGICVDQAYFAATVGKARGIPTLLFVGQGRDGGHAWVGYLKRNRTWDLDVGRYAEQNYPVGTAFNPQTWEPVKDSELIHHATSVLRNSRFPDAAWLLRWAQDNPQAPWHGETIELARSLLPNWIEPWRARARWLAASGADPRDQRDLLRAWTSQFPRMPDFKVEGQERLAQLLLASGDTTAAALVQQEIIRQNRRKRFDLGLGTAVETLLNRLDQKDWRGADLEFRRLFRQFDVRSGGSLFYQVVKPYIETLCDEGQARQARAALDFARKNFGPDPVGILSMEFERLDTLITQAGG
ncbi:MAG: hypothetical protein SNJ84_04215 [Verrucomicrobiia bacterium]